MPTSRRRACAADVGSPKNGESWLPLKLPKFVRFSRLNAWA